MGVGEREGEVESEGEGEDGDKDGAASGGFEARQVTCRKVALEE